MLHGRIHIFYDFRISVGLSCKNWIGISANFQRLSIFAELTNFRIFIDLWGVCYTSGYARTFVQ